MLGLLITKEEKAELEYLIKRELEELLSDFEDERVEGIVKRAMEEKYRLLYQLFIRVTPQEVSRKYMRKRKY
ncbi:MAG: hypothetical protein ACI4XL_08835 [Bacillus sp. (in: firmicutes)]